MLGFIYHNLKCSFNQFWCPAYHYVCNSVNQLGQVFNFERQTTIPGALQSIQLIPTLLTDIAMCCMDGLLHPKFPIIPQRITKNASNTNIFLLTYSLLLGEIYVGPIKYASLFSFSGFRSKTSRTYMNFNKQKIVLQRKCWCFICTFLYTTKNPQSK